MMENNYIHPNAQMSQNERRFILWFKESKTAISGLTHGEVYRLRCEYNYDLSVKMDEHIIPSSNIKLERMSREDASRYYNNKLKSYWMDCLADGIKKRPEKIRMKILDLMMRRVI